MIGVFLLPPFIAVFDGQSCEAIVNELLRNFGCVSKFVLCFFKLLEQIHDKSLFLRTFCPYAQPQRPIFTHNFLLWSYFSEKSPPVLHVGLLCCWEEAGLSIDSLGRFFAPPLELSLLDESAFLHLESR